MRADATAADFTASVAMRIVCPYPNPAAGIWLWNIRFREDQMTILPCIGMLSAMHDDAK